MESSEIIAIVAIISSSLVTYMTARKSADKEVQISKDNNLARRAELAYDKQLEAVREIAEQVEKIRYYCSTKKPLDDGYINQLNILYQDLLECQQKQGIFLAPPIHKNVSEYLSIIFEYKKPKEKNFDTHNDFYKLLKKQGYFIRNEIDKFIGYL